MKQTDKGTSVVVTIHSASKNDIGEMEEPIRLMTTGELVRSPGGYVLRYEESQTDEGDGTVLTQEILLMMQPGRVSMTRLGAFGTSMVFVKDRRFEGVYHTPYGDMDMAIFATQVSMDLSDDKGSLFLEYQLDMQGGFVSMHQLQLEYAASKKPC